MTGVMEREELQRLAQYVLWWNMCRGGVEPEDRETKERMVRIQSRLNRVRKGDDPGPEPEGDMLLTVMMGYAMSEEGLKYITGLAEDEAAGPVGSQSAR